MILDYNYNKNKHQLTFSYINEKGAKELLRYNVSRFKSFVETPSGRFTNWNGKACDIRMTDRPGWTEYKTFIEELPESDKKTLFGKRNPRLYTFDIEVEVDQKEFPEPEEAKFPILTISLVNDNLDAVVLGTKPLEDIERLQSRYDEWLDTVDFYKKLGIRKPVAKYIYFRTEGEMIEYFLKQIVAKAPVLAGWNSLGFDWHYIMNRVKFYYPNISFNQCSIDWTMKFKNIQDFKGNKIRLSVPNHTLVLDMMDIIGTFDMAVMPIKESLALDYIATESIGVGKIKYNGDLQHLYETDYATYVFYNLIDSVLVQLIDKRFKTLDILYTQSLICRNNIAAAFSKIAITESMFFNYFFEHNIKIVPSEGFHGERPALLGAYVRQPTAGKHLFSCCNDFSGLYPSAIQVGNLSIENYMGSLRDGTFVEADLNKYRNDKNYFVSVNGCVYKNDKDYAFKNIQRSLKNLRGLTKYTSKRLDATAMSDIDHISKNRKTSTETYPEDVIVALRDIGYECANSADLLKYDLSELKRKLKDEIVFMVCKEQAIKLIMNSMYGGSSHVAFEWFNIDLANDITGEGRNLIHIMERHIPRYFQDNWRNMTDLHKKLGITLNPRVTIKAYSEELDKIYTKDLNILVQPVAGDTDSVYYCYEGLLNTISGVEKMSITERARIIERINTEFLNQHNKEIMTEYYKTRNIRNADTDMIHEFELETIAYSEVRLDVKKRYSQMLIWKDGKYFDEDALKPKTKGLEMIKASYPALARKILTGAVRTLLLTEDKNLTHILNQEIQQGKAQWMQADIEQIAPALSVNGYSKYIISDNDPMGVREDKGCPFAVRGLAYYNWLRQTNNLPGDPLYGGKMKYYIVKPSTIRKKSDKDTIFTFQPSALPEWAEQYAPIDREALFQKCVLDPFNRIMSAIGLPQLHANGSININLFGELY